VSCERTSRWLHGRATTADRLSRCAQAADEMQGLPQPDVNLHQQRYVRYRSWQEGVCAGKCPMMR